MSVLRRRWYIFVPALVLALVITGGVFVSVEPTYSAETILLLVPDRIPPFRHKGRASVTSPFDS